MKYIKTYESFNDNKKLSTDYSNKVKDSKEDEFESDVNKPVDYAVEPESALVIKATNKECGTTPNALPDGVNISESNNYKNRINHLIKDSTLDELFGKSIQEKEVCKREEIELEKTVKPVMTIHEKLKENGIGLSIDINGKYKVRFSDGMTSISNPKSDFEIPIWNLMIEYFTARKKYSIATKDKYERGEDINY